MTDDATDSGYTRWIDALECEAKAHDDFRKQAAKVEARYNDESKSDESRFNILWSNTETVKAALYAKPPSPDVRRRYKDRDPVGREVAEVIERALSYSLDVSSFDDEAQRAVHDFVLTGLGQIRLRYVPYFQLGEAPQIPLYAELTETGAKYYDQDSNEIPDPLFGEQGAYMLGEPEEELAFEEVVEEYVPYSRFRWQPADRWANVMWCAIDHYLTEEEITEQFGEDVAKNVQYGYSDEGKKLSEEQDGKSRALLHEIFDRKSRKIVVLCKGYAKLVQEVDDPLELENFYPFPKPLFSSLSSGKLTPKPDYVFYQDQADELDRLTQRIDKLTDELRYRGVYDGSFEKLGDIANLTDGEFAPVADFSSRFPDGRSLDSVIKIMPLEDIQRVLTALHASREQVKQTIYEITGIADIIRGATKASETLGAQRMKGQFAMMRIDQRRGKVVTFMRDLLRIKAEIICERFSAETLSLISGLDVTPEMKEVMESDALRGYKVDIQTDSTIAADAGEQQQNRIELITAITGFLTQAGPMVQAGMMPPDMAKELILFGVRSFKEGRQLEEALEQMGEQQGPPPGPPQGMPQDQNQMMQLIQGGRNGTI